VKIVSIIMGLAVLALVALTLVPAAADYRAYFAVAALVAAAVLLVTIVIGPGKRPELAVAGAAKVSGTAAPVGVNPADAAVVSFLATLQEKGRLVDFLMDDIAIYSDGQVGAVARVVQAGCKAVLLEQFQILPIREEKEGSQVTVPAGYRADEYRLVGKLSGQAPFAGTLMHRGWKTESVKLSRVLRTGDDRFPTVAPAEVELQ
jgi:Domain of unknown function (DUF2760)